MNAAFKKNLPVILAFLVPLAVIGVIAISAYLPSVFVSTQYNFLYTTCPNTYDYNCNSYLPKRYSVVDSRLVQNSLTPLEYERLTKEELNNQFTARIFLYNTDTHTNTEISFDEAQALTLNPLLTSPDGVTLQHGNTNNTGMFPFFYNNNRDAWFLTKGKARKQLSTVSYNYNTIVFLGWVEPARTN